jgi:outer membrane protein assembly factor BamA
VARANSTVFGVSACMLLAGSIVFGRQQDRELSGINGVPVEGHDIVASIQFVGTKKLDLSGSAHRRFHERLRANGAELRLGWPLENQTLCRFKEVVRDVLGEEGFLDAEITHDMNPTRGNRQHVALTFTIVEGKRSGDTRLVAARFSPAERCLR